MEDEDFLIGVEYPGTIQSNEKMLQTLGGYDHINSTFSQNNRKLELKFRPNAPGCKPTCAERQKATSLVIKVKELKNSKTGETKIVHELIGCVDSIYKFNGLCDFQYLPMNHNKNEYESFKEQVSFPNIHQSKELPSAKEISQEDNKNNPLFLLPTSFSRMDTVQDYCFRRDVREIRGFAKNYAENIIGRTRQRRSLHNFFLTYDAEKVPEKPNAAAKDYLKSSGIESKMIQKVQEMFKQQKIWLKTELIHVTQIPEKFIRVILPVCAYYFSSGPWRNQWIAFGYDPRLDNNASIYQTLDYRLRFRGGTGRQLVESKRKTTSISRHKMTSSSKAKTSFIDLNISSNASKESNQVEMAERDEKFKDTYLFRSGRLPPSRQVFYQYKNILLAEVQVLIEKYKSKESCDEKNGWYKKGLDEKIRDILANVIKKTCFDVDDDNVSVAASNITADTMEYSDDDEQSDLEED